MSITPRHRCGRSTVPTPPRRRWAALALVVGLVLGSAACGQDSSGDGASPTTGPRPTVPPATGDQPVLALQAQLAQLGCYLGAVDGRHGPDVEAALAAFQGAAGITGPDALGPRTQAALAEAARTGRPNCHPGGTTTVPTTAPPEVPAEEG